MADHPRRKEHGHAGRVHLVVALAAEARPLVDHFALARRGAAAPFPYYEGAGVRLIVSGVGKVAAAAASGALHQMTGAGRHSAWLNVGVAGHRHLEPGTTLLADKITDVATGRSYYPVRTFPSCCDSAETLTVDRPETFYPEDGVYEMEASGFFATCVRFATAELVQVVKIISDNRATGTGGVTRQRVQSLVQSGLAVIDSVVRELRVLSAEQQDLHADPEELRAFQERWHFTHTQEVSLRDLLRRRALLTGEHVALAECHELRDARAVLEELRRGIAALPTEIPGAP